MRPAQPHVETLRGSTISTGGEGQQRRGTFFILCSFRPLPPPPLPFPSLSPPPSLPRPSAFLPPSRFPSCFRYFPSTNSLLFPLSCRLGFPFPPFLLPLLLLLSVPHPCRSPNSTQEGSNHWPASLRMYVLTTELGHPAAAALYGKDAHAFSKACAKPIPP